MDDLRTRILGSRPALMSVTVPEWDTTMYVRRMSLPERLGFESENGALEDINRKADPTRYVAWMVRYVLTTACDVNGQRVFHPEDEQDLAQQPGTAIERVVLAALKVNVVSAEEINQMGKASDAAPNGASPSGSPRTSD